MLNGQRVAAIIVAAGASRRMGFDKLSYSFGGKTVLQRSVQALAGHPYVDEVVAAAGAANEQAVRQALAAQEKPWRVVRGGETRAQSVANCLAATDAALAAIHDAARPFVTPQVISRALEAAGQMGAAAPAVPVKDTVKRAAQDGLVLETPARETLFAVQTPQCFQTALYRRALAAVGRQRMREATDDCSIFELAGLPVRLVEGDYANLKITTREDLPAPVKEEAAVRIGHGYDVHRLVEGRKLILGGVDIPYEKGLLGHSDADVLAHAVADALLGAAALGDIGKLFPDTDERYKGADSLVLLGHVAARVRQAGYEVENIDATVLCQRPKLAAHVPAMREKLAAACGVAAGEVSVKATTEEGLGFTGAGQGIAAHCVCLLRRTGGEG